MAKSNPLDESQAFRDAEAKAELSELLRVNVILTRKQIDWLDDVVTVCNRRQRDVNAVARGKAAERRHPINRSVVLRLALRAFAKEVRPWLESEGLTTRSASPDSPRRTKSTVLPPVLQGARRGR